MRGLSGQRSGSTAEEQPASLLPLSCQLEPLQVWTHSLALGTSFRRVELLGPELPPAVESASLAMDFTQPWTRRPQPTASRLERPDQHLASAAVARAAVLLFKRRRPIIPHPSIHLSRAPWIWKWGAYRQLSVLQAPANMALVPMATYRFSVSGIEFEGGSRAASVGPTLI